MEEPAPGNGDRGPRQRRQATAREAKALGHPLRLRVLRLCAHQELTNKQLADRLDQDPGTVLYHVRRLVDAGFLEAVPVRTGSSGAIEKPYRSTGLSWWLSTPLDGAEPEERLAPIDALREELEEAAPDSVRTFVRFTLHLSTEDAEELDRRIVAVLDDYVRTDGDRADQPAHGGLLVLHRLTE